MELEAKSDCKYEDKSYADGSDLCVAEKCMICKDGEWVDRVENYPPTESGIPTHYT